MKKFSEMFSLVKQDWRQGLIVAMIGGLLTYFENSLATEEFTFNWTNIWKVAAAAGFAYLGKKFFNGVPKIIEIDPTKTKVIEKTNNN